jgi:hypothetical protein
MLMSTPTRRTLSPGGARAASGHTTAPPSSVMNERRLIRSPQSEFHYKQFARRCLFGHILSHRHPRRAVDRRIVVAAARVDRDSAASLIKKILGDQTVRGNKVGLI